MSSTIGLRRTESLDMRFGAVARILAERFAVMQAERADSRSGFAGGGFRLALHGEVVFRPVPEFADNVTREGR